jgi:tRNA pseudouridine38-40 synthase
MTNNGTVTRFITPTESTILSSFRVNQERFDTFRQAMTLFQGTHNFHNYTITRSFKDPAAKRFMINITVDDPIMIHGMEWISVKLHGQSFMLHQIRKMICKVFLGDVSTIIVKPNSYLSYSYGDVYNKNRYTAFTDTKNV